MDKHSFSLLLVFLIYIATLALCLPLSSTASKEQGPLVFYNCTTPGHFAITFDDGPHPTITPELLELLDRLNVSATFFIVGFRTMTEWNLTRYEANVRMAYERGHHIGCHSFTHHPMTSLTVKGMRDELLRSERTFTTYFGVRPTIFRPPYFDMNDALLNLVRDEFNYKVILASIDTRDWENAGIGIEPYREAIRNGGNPREHGFIGLHHDVLPGTVELAEEAISFMRANGFTPVTISQCIGVPMYQ